MTTYHVELEDTILSVKATAMTSYQSTKSLIIINTITTFYWPFTMSHEFWYVLYMNHITLPIGKYYCYSHLQTCKLKFRKVRSRDLTNIS